MSRLVLALALAVGLATPAAAAPPFDIGYRVTTRVPTNVVVRVHVWCSRGDRHVDRRYQLEARTPIETNVVPPLADATRCNVRVVAWDRKPWVTPHGGQRPKVTTWVRPT